MDSNLSLQIVLIDFLADKFLKSVANSLEFAKCFINLTFPTTCSHSLSHHLPSYAHNKIFCENIRKRVVRDTSSTKSFLQGAVSLASKP